MTFAIRAIDGSDRAWIARLIRDRWMDDIVVGHGTVYRPVELPGLLASDGDAPVGLLTYVVEKDACEVVTLDALRAREGIGTALIDAVADVARDAGCRRLWLITTNDNEDAVAFYLACGFSVAAVHEGAVDASRMLKPSIPLLGDRGIPIHDEIELAREL